MRLIDADILLEGFQFRFSIDSPRRQIIADCVNIARQLIEEAPTIEAEPVKHGRWVYDHWCEFKCSNCANLSNSNPYKGREKYCPECGAKMKNA